MEIALKHLLLVLADLLDYLVSDGSQARAGLSISINILGKGVYHDLERRLQSLSLNYLRLIIFGAMQVH